MSDPTSSLSRAPESSSTRRRILGITAPLIAAAIAATMGLATLNAPSATAETADGQRNAARSALTLERPAHPDHIAPVVVLAPPTPTWSVAITAIGMQEEIDACQWVRMDFSSAVTIPVVAAHNFCGGAIVLDMQAGQTVALTGAGLDGFYSVVTGKDAWADQDAVDAIAGLSGDVILQTCYWADDGSERLVALQRIG